MADLHPDPRFQGRSAWGVMTEEYDLVRTTCLKHVGAEEKLFASLRRRGERQLEIVRSAMTDGCIYELKNTGKRWEG